MADAPEPKRKRSEEGLLGLLGTYASDEEEADEALTASPKRQRPDAGACTAHLTAQASLYKQRARTASLAAGCSHNKMLIVQTHRNPREHPVVALNLSQM